MAALLGTAGVAVATDHCPADLDANGIVNGGDLGVLLINWGTPGPGDINGDGTVSGADVGIMLIAWGDCPVVDPEVNITFGTTEARIIEGSSYGFATTVSVSGLGADPVTVALSLVPSDSAVAVATDLPSGGFDFSADGTAVFNTQLSGSTLGSYSLQLTATPSVGNPAVSTLPVAIVPANGVAVLASMSAAPGAIPPLEASSLIFTIGIAGTSAPPAAFSLYASTIDGVAGEQVGTLLDDGSSPDVVAGDGIYAGSISVTPNGKESVRYYKACESGVACGSGLESSVVEVNITSYPVGTVSGNPDSIVTLADGRRIYGDMVLMYFAEGTTDARIAEVIDSIGGTVIGTIPQSRAFQVQIAGDSTGDAVFQVIAQMKTVVDVDIVEPVFPSLAAEFVPNDPLYPDQTGVQLVRASETWTVAEGSVIIAIVDTGVDATHPDLDGKVIVLPGSDLLDRDDDPSDTVGHGTRMAGIAAAYGNNGVGLAGMAWRSPVMAVRAFGPGGSDVSLAAGIVFAASNGAKVISISGELREQSQILTDAVAFAIARDCLIVAASGNHDPEFGSTESFPCAIPGVVCVGGLGTNGLPLEGTNVGEWVAMAAPGESVPTTELGGGYGTATGTSPAAALVAGAAAVIWSTDPTLSALEVRERLLAGAVEIPGTESQVGAGRLDVFESTFDGSFELGSLETWIRQGTVSVLSNLGPIVPTDRGRMAYLSTGPAASQTAATLRKNFVIQPGVTEFGITFDYNFVSEEWPEFVGSQFDDQLRIVLVEPDGAEVLLAVETINESVFYPVTGINFPGGDQTVGQTGWKTVTAVIPITKGPGSYTVRVEDSGDNLYDSVTLIDGLRLIGDPNAVFCGSPEAGNCCEARETPFCVDGSCCNAVCLFDPTCCQVAWDARCADIAIALCDGLCGTPPVEICDNGLDDDYDNLIDCQDPDCDGASNCGPGPGEICANGQDDDGDGLIDCEDPDCEDFPTCEPLSCGDPAAGSCCIPKVLPYCEDQSCCETVCAADPFCCNTAWDELCAEQAQVLCGKLCAGGFEICDNGLDDDGDGLVDCVDPDCSGDTACGGGLANDDCTTALALVEGDNAIDNSNATTSDVVVPAECAKFGSDVIYHDVWYIYSPNCDGTIDMSFCPQHGGSANFDTRIAVWTGSCDGLTLVACNDDTCQAKSRVAFAGSCTETYLVQIGSYLDGGTGTGVLSVSCSGTLCTK